MLMPTVFHENLFDDFFDPFWNDAALERMMNREARDTFVAGEQKRTDWFIQHVYEKAGFFTPPYETAFSLKKRLEKRYATVTLGTVKSMAWFACRKPE